MEWTAQGHRGMFGGMKSCNRIMKEWNEHGKGMNHFYSIDIFGCSNGMK